MSNKFAISRNSPIRTVQEGLRVFYYENNNAYQQDDMNVAYECLVASVDADERNKCAQDAGDIIFDPYASVPIFQKTYDLAIDPNYIKEWQ